MVYDAATRASHRLSAALGKGVYGSLRYSPDGHRVAVAIGLTDLAEIDAKTGTVARKFTSGDQIASATYVGRQVVVSRTGWRGDVWIARDPWR
jgi:hypothetical protein